MKRSQRSPVLDKDDIIETTSAGLFQDAKDCFYAYGLLKETGRRKLRLFKIRYYLLGHSLELIFKSFLLKYGIELEYLKGKKVGHDIIKCLNLANEKGFNVINKRERKTIEQLNFYYKDKQFEYSKNGIINLPPLRAIENIVSKLLNKVKQKIEDGFCRGVFEKPCSL